jgi:hypothetical protein
MTFIPPPFSILNVNTINLDTALGIHLKRYKIEDNAELVEKRSSLEVLIARTQGVLDCGTARTTQLQVFNDLVNELRQVLQEKNKDEEKHKLGTRFLLGALLHRYFRIIQEHLNWSTRFYEWDPRGSDLFVAIRAALLLTDSSAEIAEFKKKDLEILDATTIVTALETFRDNMQLKDTKQIPRFKKYPHLAEDLNFERYLKEIIDKHKIIGAAVIKQFKAIDFIQSLAKKVEAEHQQIEQALIEWNKIFVKEHSNFSLLKPEIIESHITTHITPVALSEKVLDLFYTPYIQEMLNGLDHERFLLEMKKSNSDTATYTIFGGYALLLQSSGIGENLRYFINQALGIAENPKVLTDRDKLNGIKFFERFTKANPGVVLSCEFFGGKSEMETKISLIMKDLIDKILKESEEKVDNPIVVLQ